eukprot:CAMPEP_0119138254 /NCGR_PEP_ID=MMETSP1310-20130426/25315_1 /TAXON_ID=464262 /ORGANISM="Genus nov. species nov., Strain RCC2339" /LENGTH=564 /DNA_ID=CAMNT_0007129429 /DNA_START=1 /DNA_END=1692 /DNA_ORIENTATION=+
MSVRPDVLGPRAMAELAGLQDAVRRFPSDVAREALRQELGRPPEEVFSELSEEPVAAASLSQVYRGRLAADGREVAVKVQRPQILETVSKDLYVLRRAAEVYQGVIDRVLPQQRTDYTALLNEWAIGFYSELDFLNEAKNQARMREELMAQVPGIYVPEVVMELCTRRVVVTEWIDGVKLSECENSEIKDLVALGQECFLVQLLRMGFFHADPHPGNLIRPDDQSKGKLALIDFGLIARISERDRETIVSCIVHIANRDFAALTEDFVQLGMLPPDADRAKVQGLAERVLSPYLYGGGGVASAFQNTPGGFQALTGDLVSAMSDVPFSVPAYFAVLGRAVAVLEGIALTGDPSYRLVLESYPFVARELASAGGGERPGLRRALAELITSDGGQLQPRRLSNLISSAMGSVAAQGTFFDPDAVAEDPPDLQQQLRFLLSEQGRALREGFVEEEAVEAADLLVRQALRRAFASLPVPPSLPFLPTANQLPVPTLLPTVDGSWQPALAAPAKVVEMAAPALSPQEEVYARGMSDLTAGALGLEDIGVEAVASRLAPALVSNAAGGST